MDKMLAVLKREYLAGVRKKMFIVVTLSDVNWSLLAPGDYPPFADIVASVALTFFAYMGFSVITFSWGKSEDAASPTR